MNVDNVVNLGQPVNVNVQRSIHANQVSLPAVVINPISLGSISSRRQLELELFEVGTFGHACMMVRVHHGY